MSEPKEVEKSRKIIKTFFQKSSKNAASSECPLNSSSSKDLEGPWVKFNGKELFTASNDTEKISENLLTRSSENSNYRKFASSEESEDGSDKEIDIDDAEVSKNLMSKDTESIKKLISRAIEEHIDFLTFYEESGKTIVTIKNRSSKAQF